MAGLATYDWVVVTSANGAAATLDALGRAGTEPSGAKWAAVGPATAAILATRGVPVTFTPIRSSGEGLAAELDVRPGQRILLPRADIADGSLPERLRARGAVVDEVVAYRTVESPESSRDPLHRAFAEGHFDVLVFTSGSTIRGLLGLLTPQERRIALRGLACCIGPSTTRVARESGFGHVVEAPTQAASALAQLITTSIPSMAFSEVIS